MISKIKVSIIVPVYNVENWIEECLISLLNQTLKEIEIILINDGTKDNSIKKIEKYLDDERIILINQENKGLSGARNRGLEIAKGEYISFVDSDDYIDKEMLEKMYDSSNNLDIIFCDFISFVDNQFNRENFRKKYEYFKNNLNIKTGSKYYIPELTVVWNKLYKREFIHENNIKFIENIIHEDNDFTLRTLLLAKKVKYIEEPLYYYRDKREGSIMSSISKDRKILSFVEIIKNIKKYEDKITDDFSKLRLKINELRHFYELLDIENKEQSIENKDIDLLKINKMLEKINLTKEEKLIVKRDLKWLYKAKSLRNISGIYEGIFWKNNIIIFGIGVKLLKLKIRKYIKGGKCEKKI